MSTLTTYLLSEGSGGGIKIPHMIGGNDAPKLSFLFTVEFGFRAPFADRGHKKLEIIKYDLKNATRPNITVNQEDINYYGYRAKVGTKVNFGTVRLTFYEDSLNEANDLFANYLAEISPLADGSAEKTISTSSDEPIVLGSGGYKTIGDLPNGNEDGLLKYMLVNHHYLEGQDSKKITTYTYINPKIENVELDELDMSSSNASTISIVFSAEGVTVEHRS